MLIRREIRLNLKGFLVCTLICSALCLYAIALIPSMGADIQEILDLKMPKQLQLAFGMKNLDFHSPMGVFGIMFSYIYLTYGIYAAGMFSRIVSKEFSEKTAEYLFSLPQTRLWIILQKMGVAVGYLTASVALNFLTNWLGFAMIIRVDASVTTLLVMSASHWLGAMFFGAVAFLLSAFYIRSRLAVGLVLGAYLLQVVISLKEEFHSLRYLSPFDWFKGNDIVNGQGIPWECVVIALVGMALGFVLGARRYLRMDVLV
ncbi:MAG: hypothetical protein RLZZ165_1619 [Bacteroidota bacterium]